MWPLALHSGRASYSYAIHRQHRLFGQLSCRVAELSESNRTLQKMLEAWGRSFATCILGRLLTQR
jgi:hypothetical protein